MHELADTEHILQLALQQAQQAGARRVAGLYLVLGELSSIAEESVQFYWEIIARGTPAEGAKLYFRRAPARWRCLDCDCGGAPASESGTCSKCNSSRIRLEGGTEFYLDAIDVAPGEEAAGQAQ